jgi:hypothetical protein
LQWMTQARLGNALMKRLLLGHSILPVVRDKTSLSTVDCWCHDSMFVMCECCVPIFGKQDTHYRGRHY